MRHRVSALVMLLFVIAVFTPVVVAQDAAIPDWVQTLDVDGQMRLRTEWRDPISYAGVGNQDSDYAFLLRTRLGFASEISEYVNAYVQFQDSRDLGSEDSVTTDQAGVDLHQGYLDLGNLPYFGEESTLRLGRQLLQYGDQRLVSPLDWHNVGRVWDGARLHWVNEGWWLDGWVTVVDDEADAGSDEVFWGTYYSREEAWGGSIDAYLMGLNDGDTTQNATPRVDERGHVGTLGRYTLGLRWAGMLGGVDVKSELAYQFGHFGTDTIKAWAFAINGTKGFEGEWKPKLQAELALASGDQDGTDGDAETFTPYYTFGHAYHGYADLWNWMNSTYFKLSGKGTPREGWLVSLDLHVFRLMEDEDAWYSAGGAPITQDPTGDAGSDVGMELDLHAKVDLYDGVKAWFGWSHFFAGGFVEDTSLVDDEDQDWFFFQIVANF